MTTLQVQHRRMGEPWLSRCGVMDLHRGAEARSMFVASRYDGRARPPASRPSSLGAAPVPARPLRERSMPNTITEPERPEELQAPGYEIFIGILSVLSLVNL